MQDHQLICSSFKEKIYFYVSFFFLPFHTFYFLISFCCIPFTCMVSDYGLVDRGSIPDRGRGFFL
jgi:hypothetical protein